MPENKEKDIFLEGIDLSTVKTTAEANILPSLKIENLGIDNGVEFTVLSTPYEVKIPKEKAINSEKLKALTVQYNNVECQFLIEALSFRHQLLAIMMRKGWFKNDLPNWESIIGKSFKVWKEKTDTKKFKDAEVYQIKLLE